MARLSAPEVLSKIRVAKNAAAILRCHRHHEELRYHVQPVKEATQVSPYHRLWLGWVRAILPLDKYEQFEKFIRLPVPTPDITEQVFTQLERALQADNQYIRVEMAQPEDAADFEEYRVAIGDNQFWQDKAFQSVQTAINSVLLVDLPQVQSGPRPEPKYYLLPINPATIWDLEFKADGVAEYIIFHVTRHARAVFDDEFFRIVSKGENESWEQAKITFEAAHSVYAEDGALVDGLGYTPCARLWDNLLAPQDNAIQAKGPITKLIGKLDEYLFDYYSLRYYKAYGRFPILWEYMNKNPEHQHPQEPGVKCAKGFFLVPQPDAPEYIGGPLIKQKARVVICEECKKSRFTGPGTIKRVTPPQNANDPNLREPAGWIEPNPELIKQAEEQLKKDEAAIIHAAVGRDNSGATAQPRNELDVMDGVEVAQSMLLNVAKNIGAIRKFALETSAILRYGRRAYKRTTVDMGDEFFLKTEEQVKAEYKSAKDSGLPDYILAPIRELVSETRFRNNDEMRMRMRVLANLQPYPDRSDLELQAWLNATGGANLLSAPLLRLRMNFMAYIMQFEREQEMSVVDVATGISFDAKIIAIKARLVDYVLEDFTGENILVPVPPAPLALPANPANPANPNPVPEKPNPEPAV